MKVSDKLYYTWLQVINDNVRQGVNMTKAIQEADLLVKGVGERFNWVAQDETVAADPEAQKRAARKRK